MDINLDTKTSNSVGAGGTAIQPIGATIDISPASHVYLSEERVRAIIRDEVAKALAWHDATKNMQPEGASLLTPR